MYKCLKNTDKEYKSTGGMNVTVPRNCEYSIYWVKDGHKLPVADIKDYYINPKGVGEGICKLLNKGDVVLDLKPFIDEK